MSDRPEPSADAPMSLRDELRALRDEIRLELHLAGMEAKEAWRRLEPRVREAEEKVERGVSHATHTALQELTESVREFRASLHLPRTARARTSEAASESKALEEKGPSVEVEEEPRRKTGS